MAKARFTEENVDIIHTKYIAFPEMYGAAVYISDTFDRVRNSINWNKRLKIVLLDKGNLSMKVNGELYQLSSPSIILLSAGDNLQEIDSSKAQFKILFFHPNIISRYLTIEKLESREELDEFENRDFYNIEPFYYDTRDKYLQIDFIQSRYLLSLFNQMEDVLKYQSSDKWRCEFRAFMYHVLFKLERQFREKKETSTGKVELVDQVCTYIQCIYNEPISLDDLCSKFNMNRTSLNRMFKEHTDMTVIEYLLDLRLKMARKMLSKTELNINEICNRIGFSDPSYFSRKFKTKTGSSPTEYRDQHGA